MKSTIHHTPDFGALQITFSQQGEQILTESDAMIARDPGIEMKTNLEGGLGSALKRKLLKESLFQNTFTATQSGQNIWLAPAAEGVIVHTRLKPGDEIFLQSGAYLASTPGVIIDIKWQGAKGFFAAGFYMLRVFGEGDLWFSSYGALHTIDITPKVQTADLIHRSADTPYPGYICDNIHLVGFTTGLQYKIRKLSGLKGLIFSGEGLVCEFSGEGRLWMQTRNLFSLANFFHPFRRVKRSN